MQTPVNKLKVSLMNGVPQSGVWLSMGSLISAEIVSRAGFDWCLIDAEHGPNTPATILPQLQAMNGSDCTAIVRVPVNEDWVIKQVLDLGAQSIMVPMVHTEQDAKNAVAAMRYPPHGRRGIGGALARATGYNADTGYVATANAQVCTIVQIESQTALDNLEAIAAVDGVDALFIGPADLSADMDFAGQVDAPEVLAAIDDAIARILKTGKGAGVLSFVPDTLIAYRGKGATLLAASSDVTLLANSARALSAELAP